MIDSAPIDDATRRILAVEIAAVTHDCDTVMASDPYLVPPYTSIDHFWEAICRIAPLLAARVHARSRPILFEDTALLLDVAQGPDRVITVVPLFAEAGVETEAVQRLHEVSRKIGSVLATISILARSNLLRSLRTVIVQVQGKPGLFRRIAIGLPVRPDRTVDIQPDAWVEKEPPPGVEDAVYSKAANSPGSTMLN